MLIRCLSRVCMTYILLTLVGCAGAEYYPNSSGKIINKDINDCPKITGTF